MSFGGSGRHFWEPSARDGYAPVGSLSNVLAGNSSQLPTIQPASSPNKGAHASPAPIRAAFFPVSKGHPHATAAASSGSSTAESISELTSSSSRDSLPTPPGRNGPTTPQKPAPSTRRKKSNKANARWSRGGGSSDDTGSDRKPPTSQPAESAQSAARSPPSASKTRQPPTIATSSTSTRQTRPMATAFGGPSGDSRRGVVSPRPKGRGMTLPHVYTLAPSLTGPRRSEEHPLSQCHHLRALSLSTQ
jgi:PAB-dependent poly(A)-specific ribonuclease subunit 3